MALTRIDEFNEYFSSEFDDEDYETIGGLVMRGFGRLPRRGESIVMDDFCFKVAQADRRRVHRLEVTRESSPDSDE